MENTNKNRADYTLPTEEDYRKETMQLLQDIENNTGAIKSWVTFFGILIILAGIVQLISWLF